MRIEAKLLGAAGILFLSNGALLAFGHLQHGPTAIESISGTIAGLGTYLTLRFEIRMRFILLSILLATLILFGSAVATVVLVALGIRTLSETAVALVLLGTSVLVWRAFEMRVRFIKKPFGPGGPGPWAPA